MAKAAGFMPRNSIYVLPNNKGLYHTAPTTNATTAATTTVQSFICKTTVGGH